MTCIKNVLYVTADRQVCMLAQECTDPTALWSHACGVGTPNYRILHECHQLGKKSGSAKNSAAAINILSSAT